jgi:hypothetical protein
MSASRENGTNFAQFEVPSSPPAFELQKAKICELIEQQHQGLQLNTRTIAQSYTTLKVHEGKNIITSLVVTLKKPVALDRYSFPVRCLRWHYQDGVGVSDNEVFYYAPAPLDHAEVPDFSTEERQQMMAAMRPAGLLFGQPNLDSTAAAFQDTKPWSGKLRRVYPEYSMVQAWMETVGQQQPSLGLFLQNLLKLLRT